MNWLVAKGAAAIRNTRVALPVPPAFVAVRVTVVFPTVAGVPEISPVVELRMRPAGSAVALPKLVGVLLAVIW